MDPSNNSVLHFFSENLSTTGAVKCIRRMGKQNLVELRVYSFVFCLVSVLSLTSSVSSQPSYHVDSLVDTRNAMLTYDDKGSQ